MGDRKVSGIKKIAVLNAKAIGDFVVTLPALQAIKESYPNVELVYLGRQWHKTFLANRPTPIDRVIVIPPITGVRSGSGKEGASDIALFYKAMEKEHFDIAIQMQGSGKYTNPFLKKLGAKLTVGMKSPDAEDLDRTIPYRHYQPEILRNLEIVSLIGVTTARIEPSLQLIEADRNDAQTSLSKIGSNPFVVIHPGADDIRRRWPEEKFAAVGDFLSGQGFTIVLTGSHGESELIKNVIKTMEHHAVNTAGTVSLGGLLGLMEKAAFVVSNDTGPLHLACTIGKPTVGIYWLPNLINWGPMTRKKNRAVVSFSLACPKCGIQPVDPYPFEPQMKNCQHLVSFVADAKVSDVIKEAADLLELKVL